MPTSLLASAPGRWSFHPPLTVDWTYAHRHGIIRVRDLLRHLLTTLSLPPAIPEQSDAELVTAMSRGVEHAAAMLYDRHSDVMFGLALRMVGESADAEEVVLDAFAQAWRDADRYDASRATAAGWLTTIVRTRALDLIRARGRRARITDRAALQPDDSSSMGRPLPPPDRSVLQAEEEDAISSALGALPMAQRKAIELAFYEGLTHHEVAERLREPLGTIKTRIRLGMQKLRDLLSDIAPERVT